MIRTLLADNNTISLEGLGLLLSREEDFKIVGFAKNEKELLSSLRENATDVVVMEVNLNGGSGLQMLDDIKAINHRTKVIFCSVFGFKFFAGYAIRKGAKAFLSKDISPEELCGIIRRVHDGDTLFPEWQPKPKFSQREIQVMDLLLGGDNGPKMSEKLGINEKTINTYKNRLYKKLGVKNMLDFVEVVKYAKP